MPEQRFPNDSSYVVVYCPCLALTKGNATICVVFVGSKLSNSNPAVNIFVLDAVTFNSTCSREVTRASSMLPTVCANSSNNSMSSAKRGSNYIMRLPVAQMETKMFNLISPTADSQWQVATRNKTTVDGTTNIEFVTCIIVAHNLPFWVRTCLLQQHYQRRRGTVYPSTSHNVFQSTRSNAFWAIQAHNP